MGYAPQRKPVMERIAIRGKIKQPWLFPSLNYTCKTWRVAPPKEGLLHCFSNSRHFDCLLAVSLDNPWPQKQIPCAMVPLSGEDEERKRERERDTSSLSTDRGELNKCPCQSLSVSLGHKVSCATSKTADKQAVDLFYFLLKQLCFRAQVCFSLIIHRNMNFTQTPRHFPGWWMCFSEHNRV